MTITETKVEVKLQELLNHTSKRIIKVQNEVLQTLCPDELQNLVLISKWGCDGSFGQ